MLQLNYDYASCIRSSEKVAWKLDAVMPPETKIDFSRPFLPEGLFSIERLTCLTPAQRLMLNQISGNSYLNLFAFVEEYITAMAVKHAQAELFGDHLAVRALVRFAEEEAKHQQLFWRYCSTFERDFGHKCHLLGAAAEVAGVILGKSTLAVTLVTLHLELMTQAHYTESVRGNQNLDPLFCDLLRHHWMEEAQHARIDALELDKLLDAVGPEQIATCFDEYIELLDAFDGLLLTQSQLDLQTLSEALGQTFSDADAKAIVASQHAAYRNTFLISGMTNKAFEEIVRTISPQAADRIKTKAEGFR
ncbi:MAG: diiron oxygenase [Polyangiaceae bacterium]|nr:diiron oxygenase [Polyangiaceae bacterium]